MLKLTWNDFETIINILDTYKDLSYPFYKDEKSYKIEKLADGKIHYTVSMSNKSIQGWWELKKIQHLAKLRENYVGY